MKIKGRLLVFFFLIIRHPQRSPLFPYTTLFRSLPLVPLVKIEAQAEHARPLLPMRDEIGAFRVVEIEPPHDGETAGVLPHRRLRQFIRVGIPRSEEHTSELQSQSNLVCRLLLEK